MGTLSKLLQVDAGDTRPGWADLPGDLLESILGRLPVLDRLRFPAVCTAWQSAAANNTTTSQTPETTAPPPSPWLMLPFNPTKKSCFSSEKARFLSLTEGGGSRAYAIRQPLPAVSDRLCIGSSPGGWLVTADESSELHLLNPVTGAQVPLPSVTTLPYVDATRDAQGRVTSYSLGFFCCSFADDNDARAQEELMMIPPETFAPDRLRYEIYEKAVVLASTPATSSWAVLLICQPLSRLAFARAGDTAWTLLDTPSRCWADANSTGDVVYTMDTAGRVDAWDMDGNANTPRRCRAVAPPCTCFSCCTGMSASCRKYLVELSPGRLLQVHRIRAAAHAGYSWEPLPERVEYTTTKVELFQWTAATSQQWVQVDSSGTGNLLAGRALFLGKNASLCVPVDDPSGPLRANCVYFTDDGPWSHERCHEVLPDVGVLDLADRTYRLPRGALRDLLWKWPPPVWVFPSLAT